MQSLLHIAATLLLMVFLATGCRKEDKLSPSEEEEDVVSEKVLPQGNHPYDADILQLFQRTNTLFLYKYEPADLYYNVNSYLGGHYDPVKDSTTIYGYFDVPAKEDYVGKQLNMLKDSWLNYYSDALLKQGLPKKVFLLDSLYYAYNGPGKPLDNWPSFSDFYQGGDYFAISYGGPYFDNLSQAEKYALKGKLHSAFLALLRIKGLITPIPAFTGVTNYAALTWSNYYSLGALSYGLTAEMDWDLYVKTIVSNPYATLTAPYGILHPDTDTKGLIRKKYDIIINYFKTTINIDLQAIGDAQ